MKILFLPKYPRIGASSRLRTFQFIPLWIQKENDVKVSAFFNEEYLRAVYSYRRPEGWNVLGCYFRRFFTLLSAWNYDLIWIEKEIFPFLPSHAEWLLARLGKRFVVDYDDAVFHNYDQHSSWLIRKLMGRKIDRVMRRADVVWVGNSYIHTRAESTGAGNIKLLPTVINPARYSQKKHTEKPGLTVGWIGSPSTLKYVRQVLGALEKLNQEWEIELILVNGSRGVGFSGRQVLIPWSEETEVESIHQMDIGIMPLPDNSWERGKCAYKLIQYMACGLPVVASPVGMNSELVIHGENGFLAESEADWVRYLSVLISDSKLRQTLGEKGRALVLKDYTLEKNFTKIQKEIQAIF